MTPKKPLVYQVADILFWYNGAKIGQILPDVDGYYKFFPELKGGCLDPYTLRAIADHIDDLNREWDEAILNDPSLN